MLILADIGTCSDDLCAGYWKPDWQLFVGTSAKADCPKKMATVLLEVATNASSNLERFIHLQTKFFISNRIGSLVAQHPDLVRVVPIQVPALNDR